MKSIGTILLAVLSPAISFGAPFTNLDFDSADTSRLQPDPGAVFYNPPHQNVGRGEIADLLPGWQITFSGSPYHDSFWLNLTPIGNGLVSLYDHSNFYGDARFHIPVQGKFSFAMFPEPFTPTLFSLFQTGDVPSDARSIHFLSFGREVELFMNGLEVPLDYTYGPPTAIGDTRLNTAEADISVFAGQSVELKFVGLPTLGTGTSLSGLDSIYFSSTPVPEPGTSALIGAGLFSFGVLWLYRARRQKQHSE